MKLKKLLFLVIAAVLVLGLAACGTNKPADTTADPQNPVVSTGPLTILDNLTTDYVIVVSETDEEHHSAASSFKKLLRELTDIELEIRTDWKDNEISEHEIVIGETNRENTTVTDSMKSEIYNDGYVIKAIGQRLWISGVTGEATLSGVEYFINTYITEATVTLPEGFSYTQKRQATLPVESLTISGNSIYDYSIVTNTGISANKNLAEELQSAIWENAGAFLPVVNEANASGKSIILSTAATDGKPSYTVKTDGENLVLGGSDKDYLAEAVSYVLREYLGYRLYYTTGGYIAAEKTVAIENEDTQVYYDKITSLTISGKDISEYVIYGEVGSSSSAVKAANELKAYIAKATGTTLDFVTEKPAGKPLIKVIYNEAMGESYSIKTDSEGLTIEGGDRGVLYGAYNFLEDYIGWLFLPYGTDALEAEEVVAIDNIDVSYSQIFEFRAPFWCASSNNTYAAKNMINYKINRYDDKTLGGFYGFTGSFTHTYAALLGDDSYAGSIGENPCFYNTSNYNRVYASVLKLLASDPDAQIISVSQNDSNKFCDCDDCQGRSVGGNLTDGLIGFVNKIADAVAKDYPNVKIHTLAYGPTLDTPKVNVPRDNVIIQLANIRCCFNHPLKEECCKANQEFMSVLRAWSAVAENVYVWDYTTNFRYYATSFPNFDVLLANIRTMAEYGVDGYFAQGNEHHLTGEFGELRSFLIAKCMENPYMTEAEYSDLMNAFLKGYYGEGWTYIRKYIDFLIESSNKQSHFGIYATPDHMLTAEDFIERKAEIDSWWDAAEALATDDSTLFHIRGSRISYTYMSLLFNYDYVLLEGTVDEINAMKQACADLYDEMAQEHLKVVDVFVSLDQAEEGQFDKYGYPGNWCNTRHQMDIPDHGMPGTASGEDIYG